jgi:hypothetical protein
MFCSSLKPYRTRAIHGLHLRKKWTSARAWTESSTLLKHYVAVKTSKMKRELLGIIEEEQKNFGEWIRQFVPIWEKRYDELLKAGKLRNTSKLPKEPKKE